MLCIICATKAQRGRFKVLDLENESQAGKQILCIVCSFIWLILGVVFGGVMCIMLTVLGTTTLVRGASVFELVLLLGVLISITLFCGAFAWVLFWAMYRVHECDTLYLLFKIVTILMYVSVILFQLVSIIICFV